jgi:hypothetical protein
MKTAKKTISERYANAMIAKPKRILPEYTRFNGM